MYHCIFSTGKSISPILIIILLEHFPDWPWPIQNKLKFVNQWPMASQTLFNFNVHIAKSPYCMRWSSWALPGMIQLHVVLWTCWWRKIKCCSQAASLTLILEVPIKLLALNCYWNNKNSIFRNLKMLSSSKTISMKIVLAKILVKYLIKSF